MWTTRYEVQLCRFNSLERRSLLGQYGKGYGKKWTKQIDLLTLEMQSGVFVYVQIFVQMYLLFDDLNMHILHAYKYVHRYSYSFKLMRAKKKHTHKYTFSMHHLIISSNAVTIQVNLRTVFSDISSEHLAPLRLIQYSAK